MNTQLTIPFPTFTQNPSCGYAVTYSCYFDTWTAAQPTPTGSLSSTAISSMVNCDTTNN